MTGILSPRKWFKNLFISEPRKNPSFNYFAMTFLLLPIHSFTTWLLSINRLGKKNTLWIMQTLNITTCLCAFMCFSKEHICDRK